MSYLYAARWRSAQREAHNESKPSWFTLQRKQRVSSDE